jgi:hypothetical protein
MPEETKKPLDVKHYVGEVKCVEQNEQDPTHWLVHFTAGGGQFEGMFEFRAMVATDELPYAPGDPIGIVLGSRDTRKILLPGTKAYERKSKQIFERD